MGPCLSANNKSGGGTTSRGGLDFGANFPSSDGGGRRKSTSAASAAAIAGRIESIQETKTITFGGVHIRYAYISQRGYYPDDPNKANQDAYCIEHDFAGQPTDAFFGVFDGHGRDGDKCAQFARNHLPPLTEKFISKCRTKEFKLSKVRRGSGTARSTTTTSSDDGNRPRRSGSSGSMSGGGVAESPSQLELTKDQIQAALLKAHTTCNRNMHQSHKLDDSLSGTTAISLYLHGRRNRITVSNVGDSRAILGTSSQETAADVGNNNISHSNPNNNNMSSSSSLKALPLSRDQTPYRRDERARVKKTGARILSLDQIEGLEPINDDDDDVDGTDDLELGEELDEGGDPPRVWSPIGEYPGTAFTRSLGDSIAEDLGVFAEPEMLTRELSDKDKIIVLASDGVFEFLTNQSVIDMCAKFRDPLEACRAVVAESYELWLQYELRTDDITMICIFVDQVEERGAASDSFLSASMSSRDFVSAKDVLEGMTAEDQPDSLLPLTEEACKPVRQHISKEKSEALRKMKIKMTTEELKDSMKASEEIDLSKLYTEKTSEEKERISEAIRASVMFQNITEEEREMIFGVMEPIDVKKGTWVIKQGTVGDRFYIVDDGRFEVRIVPEGQEDDGSGGNVVHVYEGSAERHAHPSFGELALMYSAPRAASIISETDGRLWALHRYAFRKVLAQQSGRKELIHSLKKIDAFRKMKQTDLHNVATCMEQVTFVRGESIITRGQEGDALFVVLNGSVEHIDANGQTGTLKAGDYFGVEVLTGNHEYAATVVSLTTTCCWKLDKATLKRAVPSLNSAGRSSADNVA